MRVLAVIGIVAVGVLALLAWTQRRPQPFFVSGFVEAEDVRVGSRVGGRVARVEAVEGQSVKQGETLLILEPHDLQERRAEAAAQLAARQAVLTRLQTGYRKEEIEQARARRDRAQSELDKLIAGSRPLEIKILEDRVEVARADLVEAEAEYQRVAALYEKDHAVKKEMDEAVRQVDGARARSAAARDELSLAREGTRAEDLAAARFALAEAQQALALMEGGYRVEEIEQTRAEVEALQAALAAIDKQLSELTVVAPRDGVIEALDLQPGDLVGPNAPLLTLLLRDAPYVRAFVPENRLTIKPQQDAAVRVDSFPGRTFHGHVTFIASQGEFTPNNVQTPEERVKQVFRIKVVVDDPSGELRPGMSADVFLDRNEYPDGDD